MKNFFMKYSMVKNICIFVIFNFFGCAEGPSFENFSHEENKGNKEFLLDSQKCTKNKDKHRSICSIFFI